MTIIEPFRNALGTIQSLYNFLHGSTKHHALFKDSEVHEEDVALTIKIAEYHWMVLSLGGSKGRARANAEDNGRSGHFIKGSRSQNLQRK